jgi:hypothetical protein
MATNATNKRRASWERAFRKYQDLILRIEQAEHPQLDALGRALAAQVDLLLELPAPSFDAVRQKLVLIWEADLEKPDRDGAEKLLIIEDLGDLIVEGSQVLGLEPEPQAHTA